MQNFQLNPIGKICAEKDKVFVKLESKFIPALQELVGFSHINVIWWFSDFDNDKARDSLEVKQPYKKAPLIMGIFATRSPIRPNPIALSTVKIIGIDYENGIIKIPYIDAKDGSPVIDIKPYTPSLDRVETPEVPDWCRHWPMSLEQSAKFDWGNEFNF
jgi:tRNA-Thr(GGU) m(6)t(6)A37 methyltransferase TsaA